MYDGAVSTARMLVVLPPLLLATRLLTACDVASARGGAAAPAPSPETPAPETPAPETPAPWPDWILVTRRACTGTDVAGAVTLTSGTLVGMLSEHPTTPRVQILATGRSLDVPRTDLARSSDWVAAYGAPVRLATGDIRPAVALSGDRAWVREADGTAREVAGVVSLAPARAPTRALLLAPGDAVTLTCTALSGSPDGALLPTSPAGPARAQASRGEWTQVATDSATGWVPATCAEGGTMRVAAFAPLPNPTARRAAPLLVHFWATWCAPCLAEIEEYAAFSERHPGRTLAVSEDFRRDEAHVFLATRQRLFASAWDDEGRLLRSIGGAVLPLTVVYGPDGREQSRWEGPTAWTDPAIAALVSP